MIEAFYSETGERTAARALLARAVRELYGVPCPEIAREPSGKPFFPSRPDIRFSLSHTRTHVMVCVSDSACGCDIETLRPVRPSVVSRVCSPEELGSFSFFELWTLKESFLKLHGSLPYPFWQARFTLDGGTVRTPDPILRAALYDLGPCAAALCTPLPPPASLTAVPPEFLI